MAKLTQSELATQFLVQKLKEGTAPWQMYIKPGQAGFQRPYNATTGKPYSGGNSVWLLAQGFGDPRFATFKQAKEQGWNVRRGEHGFHVVKWISEKTIEQDDGTKAKVKLDRPLPKCAVVFNAQQLEGVPPLVQPTLDFEPHERAEALLAASGADIRYVGGQLAFYSPAQDYIQLPLREQFVDASALAVTALHELGHWTGHPSRLGRDLSGKFGSESYAREELVAEIASMMVGTEISCGHDPGQHAAYVAHWIRILERDPKEIYRAASKAQSVFDYVMTFDRHVTRNATAEDVHELESGSQAVMARENVHEQQMEMSR